MKITIAKTGDRHEGKLAVDVHANFLPLLEQIPGYAWSNIGKTVVVPKSWPSVLALSTLATEKGLKLQPDTEVSEWYRETAQEWKTLRTLAFDLGEGHKAEGLTYYPHQIAGARWLLADTKVPGRLLLDETGTGKTMTFVSAIQDGQLHKEGPILVVCPESVMTTGWAQGLEKFAPDLRVAEISGTPAKRKQVLAALKAGDVDVAIIGYSNLRSHTRAEAFPGHALRRCVKCGGPRLTTMQQDENGKLLPDLLPHDDGGIRANYSTPGFHAYCKFPGCDWTGAKRTFALEAAMDHAEHTLKVKKITELTPAQCQTHRKELNEIGWSAIIVDEAHRVLNPRSQTAQAVWGVAHYAPSEPRRWAATGTPISRQVEQTWSLLHYLDPVAWPVKSKWVSWYFKSDYNYAGFMEVLGLKDERKEEFDRSWSAVTRRVLKAQVLDLPPKLRWGSLEERLTMSGEQLRVYNAMRDEMLVMVDEGAITASNVMIQARKLSMLASGTGYPLDGNSASMGLRTPSVKCSAIAEMWHAGEWEGEQMAMLFSSRRALLMAEQYFYDQKLLKPTGVSLIHGEIPQARRTEDINDFQAGKKPVVMLTYAAGGTGITLTAASRIIVFERDWSTVLNAQGIDRFHRIGSERHSSVVFQDFVVSNSNEIKQLERLEEGAERLEDLVHDREKLRALFE